jgi:DNA-binding SARP family transcriptional activator/predicted ATPase
MPLLRLYLFGTPRVERDGQPVPIGRRKTLALLVYLAVTGQPTSRETLATLLWPEYDQASALANLRRDLSRMKEALGEPYLVVDRMQAGLDTQADVWSDVQAFQELVKHGLEHVPAGGNLGQECLSDLEEAAALYHDDFLAGFNLPDSPDFDEWQFFEAEQLRRMFAEALKQLVQAYVHMGQFDTATGHARRWLSLDNLHEPAHRTLMQLYAWSGQQAAALRQYEECRRLLKEQLAIEPEGETQALYTAIKTRQLTTPSREQALQVDRPPEPRDKTARVHLPSHSTPFIGREDDLAALGQLLEQPGSRLLTILGPGGIGKTRLSVEAARSAVRAFQDGVYFIPLAPLHSAADIPFTIAESLGYHFFESGDPKQQLLDYLRSQDLLLVLDNFEHLLDGAGLLVDILQAAPGVNLLVSSREKLNLSAEQVYSLGSLAYPDEGASVDPFAYDAVQLLLQSARLVRPAFEPQAVDLEAMLRICQLVQGMPLALVLAAGWLEALSLEEIAGEIAQSLDILETELQDLPERQRSVRAVFDYSWSRLSPEQQQAYVILSVFRGGFERQAAQAVAGADLKTIRVLLNKSWLHRDASGRYQVHELLRQFAQEKLAADRSLWEQARSQHSNYYAGILESVDQAMRGPGQKEAFQTVAIEFENIRNAWHFLIERKQFREAVDQILPALFRYCEARSRAFELLRLLDEIDSEMASFSEPSVGDRLFLVLLTARYSFYPDGMPVRFESFGHFWVGENEELIQAWFSVQKPVGLLEMGFWGINLAYLYGRMFDRDQGIVRLKELFPALRTGERRWELAYGLQHLAQLLEINFDADGDHSEIEKVIPEALDIFEQLGDERESGYTLKVFGQLRRFQHRIPESIGLMKAAQSKLHAVGDWPVAANIYGHLGDIYLQNSEFEEGFRCLREMARAYLERGHKKMAASVFSKESYEALRHSDIQHALRAREESLVLARETGDDLYEPWYVWELGEIYRVSGDYTNARLHFDKAMSMFTDDLNEIGYVFYHRGLGDLAYATGDYAESSRQFGESLRLAQEFHHDWAESYSQTGFARAEIQLGNLDTARSSIANALHLAKKVDEKGVALVALAGAAEYFSAIKDTSRALELATFVQDHPVGWRETKARAGKVVASCQGAHPHDPEAGFMDSWQGRDLWEILTEVIDLLI